MDRCFIFTWFFSPSQGPWVGVERSPECSLLVTDLSTVKFEPENAKFKLNIFEFKLDIVKLQPGTRKFKLDIVKLQPDRNTSWNLTKLSLNSKMLSLELILSGSNFTADNWTINNELYGDLITRFIRSQKDWSHIKIIVIMYGGPPKWPFGITPIILDNFQGRKFTKDIGLLLTKKKKSTYHVA